MAKITYLHLTTTLEQEGISVDASETHGIQVGIFCGKSGTQNEPSDLSWQTILQDALHYEALPPKTLGVLTDLQKQIQESFQDLNFDLNLLLPDNNETLEKRVMALGDWCRGFLCGLGLAGVTIENLETEIVKEIIQDLSQIAHIDTHTSFDAYEEDNEKNYSDLVEYIRVATQNVQIELKLSQQQTTLH